MLKPHGHKTSTGSGTINFVSTNGVPPRKLLALAIGGTATFFFANAGGGTMPRLGLGDTALPLSLPAGVPIEFDLEGCGMTSAVLTIGTATSVEWIWEV